MYCGVELYDLIVIGTGPAGLTLAHKYEQITGNKMLMIESGRRSRDNSHAQALSTVVATGDFPSAYYPLHNQRIFGGTSTVWNGWCAVLEKRSFLNNEWPFSYDDLYAYYPEAADVLNVPEMVHTRRKYLFPKKLKGISYSELPENIKALYHQDFARALPALSLEDLFAELSRRGVYKRESFHISEIRVNAVSDSLVEFDNFLYTESELLLYAMVARLHEAGSVFLE